MVTLAHLSLACFVLLLVSRLISCHYDVFKINIVVHVVKCCLGLGWGLVELSKHVKLVMDILRRISLRMQEHRVRIDFRICLLLANLHFYIS